MISLKKISIQNFKGIYHKIEVDLKQAQSIHFNVLAGPNGFGKTTIFDALEVCLTGEFRRITTSFNKAQSESKDRNKPFFQNIQDEDVLLKLWVEDSDKSENYIIVKRYNAKTPQNQLNGGRRNKPSESSQFFETYLYHKEENFILNEFTNDNRTTQGKINAIFYGEGSQTKMNSVYYLFNYLQQEDSIHFLKQKESDKGEALAFLLNIEQQEIEKAKLSEIKSHITDQKKKLSEEKKELGKVVEITDNVSYFQLFENNAFDFDQEKLFDVPKRKEQKFEQYNSVIDDLIDFKRNFSVIDYKKSIIYKKVNKELANNTTLISNLLIKNVSTKKQIEEIEKKNDKILKSTFYSAKQATEKLKIEEPLFLLYFDKEKYESYIENFNQYEAEKKELGEIDKIISDLITYRRNSMSEYEKLRKKELLDEKKCPLCNSQFESYIALIDGIDKKTEQLQSYNSSKLKKIESLENQLNELVELLEKEIEDFTKKNLLVPIDVLDKIKGYQNSVELVNKTLQDYPELLSEEAQKLYFKVIPQSLDEFSDLVVKMKKIIEENILNKHTYKEGNILNSAFFVEYFDKDEDSFKVISEEKLVEKKIYIQNEFFMSNNQRLEFLNGRIKKLGQILNVVDKKILKVLDALFKNYKKEMIEKIKIPFYVYSGKILQSYQQGLGIFIDIHTTGKTNHVSFKTNHKSDHDIVYHLSSGQMAVAAIAFCLSLNKVFDINRHFKFLAIDDPIQTMDDLNVHTFIELIRNDFSDYQILMSTHDDFVARYMKYKFDKFNLDTKIQNVQKIYFDAIA